MAKVLLEKESASNFWKAKLIFTHDKKRQRSKCTSKTFEIKNGQKSKNVALEILKQQCPLGLFFSSIKSDIFLKRTRIS